MDPRILPLLALLRSLFEEQLTTLIKPVVEAALTDALPEVLRRAALPSYLSRKEVAVLTGWGTRKLDYLVAERRIPCLKRGRSVLFKAADIEAYLEAGFVAPKRASEVA